MLFNSYHNTAFSDSNNVKCFINVLTVKMFMNVPYYYKINQWLRGEAKTQKLQHF